MQQEHSAPCRIGLRSCRTDAPWAGDKLLLQSRGRNNLHHTCHCLYKAHLHHLGTQCIQGHTSHPGSRLQHINAKQKCWDTSLQWAKANLMTPIIITGNKLFVHFICLYSTISSPTFCVSDFSTIANLNAELVHFTSVSSARSFSYGKSRPAYLLFSVYKNECEDLYLSFWHNAETTNLLVTLQMPPALNDTVRRQPDGTYRNTDIYEQKTHLSVVMFW